MPCIALSWQDRPERGFAHHPPGGSVRLLTRGETSRTLEWRERRARGLARSGARVVASARRSVALVAILVGLVAIAPVARGDAPRAVAYFPDLSISIDQTTVSADSRTLTISASVRNVGDATAAASVARAQAAGVQATPQDTPSLAPKDPPVAITFTVALPVSAQGTNQKVVVSVDPVEREPDVANNSQSSAVAIPKPPPQP